MNITVAMVTGYWYMHCHTEFHNELGMALVLQEGQIKDMSAPPADLPQCGNMDWTSEECEQLLKKPRSPGQYSTLN